MYSLVSVLSLVILLVLNFDVLFNKDFRANNTRALKAYRFFLISLSLFYVCDLLWGYLDPLENKIYVTIDTAVFFILMSLTLFAFTNFVVKFVSGGKIFTNILFYFGLAFFVMGTIVVIVNFFHPILFTYESSTYAVNAGRYIFYGIQNIAFFLVTIFALVRALQTKGYKRGQFFTLFFVGIVMTVTIAAQIYFPLFPCYAIGCSLGTVLIYSFIVVSTKTQLAEELYESKSREEAQQKVISATRELAYVDPLTGVKNKHAYVEVEIGFDGLIHDKKISNFALLLFDLNDLKKINDLYGHDKGDIYIKKSCEMIKQYFPNTIIYRYGGDEFVVILQGKIYDQRFKLIQEFNHAVENNIGKDEPVIAVGFSDFLKDKDNTLRTVFLRADERMYGRKRRLKDLQNNNNQGEEVVNKSTGGVSLMTLRHELYEMFYHSSAVSLVDMLNGSSCDEIVEFDIKHDTFKQFYHVEGKYFVPAVDLSYRDLLDFTYKYIIHPDDRGTYMGLMQIEGFFERLQNARIPNFDFAHFRYKLQDGTYRWVEQVVIAGDEFGIPEGMFRMYVFDIHNIKSRQLGNISDVNNAVSIGRDPLTSLRTSKEFIKASEKKVSSNPDKTYCLLAIDIEHFKLFDEWFGREKGNLLLANMGAELGEFEKNNDAVCGYFGADDFTILMEYDADKIQYLYDRIHELINSFGLSTGFLPALGVSIIDKDMSVVDAFDRATIAVNKAKQDIKNRIVTYNIEMQFLVEHEHLVLTNFIHALQNDQITFYLQPQCNIKDGKIVGAEALARWCKPDGTIIAPGEFVPVLEKYGFITDLDKVIWERVIKWTKEFIDAGHKVVPISLNVSQIDVLNIDIDKFLKELCQKYGLPTKYIKVEITESAYAKNTNNVDKLVKQLKADGFMILLDDFGSGYSSLNMLSALTIDAIKLDAKFLQIKDETYKRSIHILESAINMAKTMALPMIVEGAEKKEQIDFLRELGVDFIQGYYFYKPMPIKDFEALISKENIIDTKGLTVKLNDQFRIREFLDKNIYSDSMLNNIIGAVAIYSLRKNHVDIVRYNQQFYETVNVPDFVEKLENIEITMPEEDSPLLIEALKEAKANKLTGASKVLRFYRANGELTSFDMHFYYIGIKEGTDRFYGACVDVSELVDHEEGRDLIRKYSSDNIIFIKRIDNKWSYLVVSHALSDLVGLSPLELQEELNNGKFVHRITPQKDIKDFMKMVEETVDEHPNYNKVFTVLNNERKKLKIEVEIKYVGNESNNIKYLLRTRLVEKEHD